MCEDNKPALALPDFRWLISVLVAEFGKLHEKGLTAAFLSCLGTSMFINKVFLFFFQRIFGFNETKEGYPRCRCTNLVF